MTLVVDASVVARWFLSLEKSDVAAALLRSGERLIAPDLVIVEATNTAWKARTFGDVPFKTVIDFVEKSGRLFHELVPAAELKDRAFEIALSLKHPAYDCFYLALAEQRECRLVTADERLQARCSGTRFAKLVKSL
jgi:predicted nucleic acid-binding protein